MSYRKREEDLMLKAIKQDYALFYTVLTSHGYEFEKRTASGDIFRRGDQKTGCFFLKEKNGVYQFKEFSSYLEKGGTIVDFLMQIEQISLAEAIRKIKEIAGIAENERYNYRPTFKIPPPPPKTKTVKNNFTTIKKRYVFFSMEKLEGIFPRIANYLKRERKIENFTKLEVYKATVTINADTPDKKKEWDEYFIGVPYGFSLLYEKNTLKTIPEGGVELRRTKPNTKYKTASVPLNNYKKTPSFLLGNYPKNLWIFESIFDYLALQSKIFNAKNNISDIVILNGSALAKTFVKDMLLEVDDLKKRQYEKIYIMHQNDSASKIAYIDIFPALYKIYPSSHYYMLAYDTQLEDGFDVNDLVQKSSLSPQDILENRLKPFDNIDIIAKIISNLQNQGMKNSEIFQKLSKNKNNKAKSLNNAPKVAP